MNQVTLQGNLARDCHVTESKKGQKVVFMTVKASREGGSDFVPVKAFGVPEAMIAVLKDGAAVAVTGHFQSGKYDKAKREQLYDNTVVANAIQCNGGDGHSGCAWNEKEVIPVPAATVSANN